MLSFQSNCSFPSTPVNFVSSPNTRGTLQILWSCLSLLLLCSWSIQHLDLPVQSTPKTYAQRIRVTFRGIWRKTTWMILTLLAPEVISSNALCDFLNARHETKLMQELASLDGKAWSNSHSHLASMGGFALRFRDIKIPPNKENVRTTLPTATEQFQEGQEQVEDIPAERLSTKHLINQHQGIPQFLHSLVHNLAKEVDEWAEHLRMESKAIGDIDCQRDEHNLQMLQTVLCQVVPKVHKRWTAAEIEHDLPKWYKRLVAFQADTWVLEGPDIRYLRNQGIIDILPNVSQAEIEDQSKSDMLVKVLGVMQFIWLIMQLIDRVARSLHTTILEIVTLAFSCNAFITYILTFQRPQDVRTIRYINAVRYPTPKETWSLAQSSIKRLKAMPSSKSSENFFHDYSYGYDNLLYRDSFAISMVVIAVFFGCIHAITWNFSFPTIVEQFIWRISIIISIVAPMMCYAVAYILDPELLKGVILFVILGIYFFARLYIMVETFRSLFFLPPGAFIATWSSNGPHFG